MRSQTHVVTLECAGNGRTLFDPPIDGEKWNLGAASTAEWTGVPLSEILDRAGVQAGAREVLFRGADGGRSQAMQTRCASSAACRSIKLAAPMRCWRMP